MPLPHLSLDDEDHPRSVSEEQVDKSLALAGMWHRRRSKRQPFVLAHSTRAYLKHPTHVGIWLHAAWQPGGISALILEARAQNST